MTGQWERFQKYFFHDEELGFSLDISRMNFGGDFLASMHGPLAKALEAMDALERGAIANPDEKRMVGHYWLRGPELLRRADLIPPQIREELEREIRATNAAVLEFVRRVQVGEILGQIARPFRHLLLVGIGGSALGPQLVADALGTRADALTPHFLDNTDPDGICRVFGALQGSLDQTLTVVISKSGETRETRMGMEEARAAYARENLHFALHAVAVTQRAEKSSLFRTARDENWLAIFPMWDWVGGRTSVTSAVGLLPAALQGLDTAGLLAGARAMDALTRRSEAADNPAALLALMWHHTGRGEKDMVIVPYKDRLLLFSKYLQQLVMESLGKTRRSRDGNPIDYQGIAVYGNKGSTDQHAYVQQLREGRNNFFLTFIEVLGDEAGSQIPKEQARVNEATAGDYLAGFLLGTRRALGERESMTITIRRLDARALGMLIALFERAVGLYASLAGINAYHQPGVEGGKKAAEVVLIVQRVLLAAMAGGAAQTARAWSERIGAQVDAEVARAGYPELPVGDRHEQVFKILERLAANPGRGVTRQPGAKATEAVYAH